MNLGRIGVIGRFKPLHKGAYAMFQAVCEQAEHLVIGIGSSNKYNLRNPFTAEETAGMIHAVLAPRFKRYSIVSIPDYAHKDDDPHCTQWKAHVMREFGDLNAFITSNPYVAALLEEKYYIIHPAALLPAEKRVMMRASHVRKLMARGDEWKAWVPQEIATYLKKHNLIERFRDEFGLETLARLAHVNTLEAEDAAAEELHTVEA